MMALEERAGGVTIGSALTRRATEDPERGFIVYGSQELTLAQLDRESAALAASLYGLGIAAGDRIALVLPAWPEFVVSLFAAAKLGAVVVPLNPRLPSAELKYMLRHSEVVAAITVEVLDEVDYLQIFEDLLVELPELRYLVTVGEEDLWYDDRIFQFEDLVSAGEGREFPDPDTDPHEIFAVVYTSGTTGKPKGVQLTQANLLEVASGTAEAIGLTHEDSVVGVQALFHVFGLGPGILGSLLGGSTLILNDASDEDSTVDLIERHGVTVQCGVPTDFVRALQTVQEEGRDVSSLRLALLAGAPVRDELVERLREDYCPVVLVAYSLAETAATVCVTRPSDSADQQRFTVGRPLPGTEVRILERDGETLPVESVGEIAVRGPGVMKGYSRQPRDTAKAFDPEGFFLTGDLGIIDEDGYVHLVGRRKDIIIRGGSNVYPREVEERIHAHPAVHESATVGIPDEVLGEAICACVVLEEGAIVTEEEVREWCRGTLADYKVPDLIRFFDEIPLTETGKVRRPELVRMVTEDPSARRN